MEDSGDEDFDAFLRELARDPTIRDDDPEVGPGDRLGDRYLLRRRIGSGGMGTVFEAEDERLRRTVAIKLLKPGLAADPKLAERFEREALAASRVSHPNVVSILDYAVDGEVAYLVMEELRGETLAARLGRGGPLPVDETLTILAPVMAALSHAHSLGVVHRDIKPANVFLAEEAGATTVKVLDFGIAKLDLPDLVRLTRSGTDAMGTPAYMAPEQFKTAHDAGPAADQYAVGTIAYEMLAGRLPYEERTKHELVVAKATQPASPIAKHVPELPNAIAGAIMRSLAVDPADRHPSVDGFRSALVPDAGRADPSPTTARTGPIRPPWVVPVFVVVVLGLVAAMWLLSAQ